jgi:hypothetical protein
MKSSEYKIGKCNRGHSRYVLNWSYLYSIPFSRLIYFEMLIDVIILEIFKIGLLLY